jgi:hypothetical protein
VIYTFDIRTLDGEDRTVQQGVFTSDDIVDVPADDEEAEVRTYVEAQVAGQAPPPLRFRAWRRLLDPMTLTESVPADLTWTWGTP